MHRYPCSSFHTELPTRDPLLNSRYLSMVQERRPPNAQFHEMQASSLIECALLCYQDELSCGSFTWLKHENICYHNDAVLGALETLSGAIAGDVLPVNLNRVS